MRSFVSMATKDNRTPSKRHFGGRFYCLPNGEPLLPRWLRRRLRSFMIETAYAGRVGSSEMVLPLFGDNDLNLPRTQLLDEFRRRLVVGDNGVNP